MSPRENSACVLKIWLHRLSHWALLLLGCLGGAGVLRGAGGAIWQNDYSIAEGFRIQRDTTGYHLPTAIAFVPHPGPGPKDPLYFVTELRGKLKVVTNDRTVLTFADGFQQLVPHKELPDHLGEIGMAGICLEPEHGYIFVSYAYADADGLYRNAIMRFDTQPGTFAIKPTGQKRLATVLDGFLSNVAHQIGPLAVVDGCLLVTLGDAYSAIVSRDLDASGGKVLRMNFDGEPLSDNPFARDTDPTKIRNFVWAYGFRNPFSLFAVKGHVFVADNGIDIDRFVELKRGDDFLYSGSQDASGSNALFVWSPAVGPVQLAYDLAGDGTAAFPSQWKNKFFLALCGSPTDPPGPNPRRKCVVALGVDFQTSRLSATPVQLMRYVGSKKQLIAGVAVGHDGLYVAHLLPDSEGVTAILHVDYKPDAAHPRPLSGPKTAQEIMQVHQCFGCHQVDQRGFGSNAPDLSRDSLVDLILDRIDTPEYEKQLATIDALTTEPYIRYRQARAEVRAAEGREKARLWIKYRILEPKFDRTVVAMPNVGMTEPEAQIVSTWLAEPTTKEVVKLRVRSALPTTSSRSILLFGLGCVAGVLSTAVFVRFKSRSRKRSG